MLKWRNIIKKHYLFCLFTKDMIGRKAPPVMSGNVTPSVTISSHTTENITRKYEEAINKLNTLQSNASVLAQAKNNRLTYSAKGNIQRVEEFIHRAGMKVEQLDDLSIIHVSGTKGKGSVCALCESILRASGLKTGFFSSPHLVEVRERIRINGKPLSPDLFTSYFNTVFDRLEETKADHGDTMPAYFRFLTVMAFHVFLQEKVDVAVLEVGIGGAYDCTNVIRKPVAVGITSLGLDHTGILGDTIEKIAWHKAAIAKPGRPAFTVPQPEGAMKVVLDTAKEFGASSIECVPDISEYDLNGVALRLGLMGKHQLMNASLALQLCKAWVRNYSDNGKGSKHKCELNSLLSDTLHLTDVSNTTVVDAAKDIGMATARPFVIPLNFMKGLESCYWPGRNQTVKCDNVTYYLDGAHTPRSITACQNWFMTAAEEESWILDRPIKRILIFNSTGDRDEYSLLRPLIGCQFDGAAFCPNVTSNSSSNSADLTSCAVSSDKQLARCQRNLIAFEHLTEEEAQAELTLTVQDMAKNPSVEWHSRIYKNVTATQTLVSLQHQVPWHTDVDHDISRTVTKVLPSISDALRWAEAWVERDQDNAELSHDVNRQKAHVQVLITGSLHLVGGVIKVIDPELVNRPGS